jgi:hypothetical protein
MSPCIRATVGKAGPMVRLMTASSSPPLRDRLPKFLVAQLRAGARLVIPIGEHRRGQKLMVFEKTADGTLIESCGLPVAFVPLVGG